MEELSCQICMYLYNTQKNPLLLPCGHTFCKPCLEQHERVSFQLSCPFDQRVFVEKLEDLVVNRIILDAVVRLAVPCDNHASEMGLYYTTDEPFGIFCDDWAQQQTNLSSISYLKPWLEIKLNQYRETCDPELYIDKFMELNNFNALEFRQQIDLYRYWVDSLTLGSRKFIPQHDALQESYVVKPDRPNPMPILMERPRPAQEREVIGLPIPPGGQYGDEYILNRFETIRQSATFDIETQGCEAPWHIGVGKNQIEFFTFTTTAPVQLVGFSVCRSAREEPCKLTYVEVRWGKFTGSPSIYRQDFQAQIDARTQADPSVWQVFRFSNPVAIQPYKEYTWEFQISETRDVFSGNGATKPDLWIGDDCTIWDFKETTRNTDVYTNGSNHVTGPLLQIYYKSSAL